MSESGTGLPPTAGDLVWPALNFVLFVALLVRFLREPIREYFRARGERLGRALEAGAQARAEAEALRAQLARDIADLPALRERLRADLLATAAQEREDLLERARRAAEHIKSDAALVAEQELVAALQAVLAASIAVPESPRTRAMLIWYSPTPVGPNAVNRWLPSTPRRPAVSTASLIRVCAVARSPSTAAV